MSDKAYIGIDLGKDGGICIMRNEIIITHAMPLTSEKELDILAVKHLLLATMFESHVIFEKITPLHQASKKANWSLAHQSGAIEALCISLDIPYTAVPAKKWQKDMFVKLPPLRTEKGNSDTKGLALIVVKTLYPNIPLTDKNKPKAHVPHNGIVDSICLAGWAKLKSI